MLLALATFVFLHTLTASALGPLPTLSFYLHDDSIYEGSSTTNDVIATLWFNFTIYQYTLPSTKKGSIQTSTSNDLTIIDEYNCDILHNNKADETKLMIENNDADGVILNKIQLMTASGTWYGLQHVCITEEEWIIWQRDFSELIDTGSVDVATCSSGKARNYFCIDNDPIECAPYKQMYYFDRLRPNEYIQDAECVDGTDIIAQFESCEPTKAPTLSPSKQATISPTLPPNTQPTISPIKAPLTNNPSQIPSQQTGDPSSIPTYNPSHQPSQQPSETPTTIPSNMPSSQPSTPPTYGPSSVPTETPTRGKEQEVNDPTETTAFVVSESVIANQSSIDWILVVVAICVSVLIICTVAASVVFYKKCNNTTDKAIGNLEAEEVVSKEDGEMNVNQIPNEEISLNDEGMSDGQLASNNTNCKMVNSGTTDGNNVFNVQMILKGSARMTRGQSEVDADVVNVVDDSDADSDDMYPVCVTETSGTKGFATKEGE
eukprot:27982_1